MKLPFTSKLFDTACVESVKDCTHVSHNIEKDRHETSQNSTMFDVGDIKSEFGCFIS